MSVSGLRAGKSDRWLVRGLDGSKDPAELYFIWRKTFDHYLKRPYEET